MKYLITLITVFSFLNGNSQCQANFTYSDSSCVVFFSNNSTGAFSYLWDFGDGNQSSLENPSHYYSTSGSYDVTLETYDSNGVCASYIEHVTVNCSGSGGNTCQANFTYSDSSCVIFFNNSSSGAISYLWDFGDGNQSTLENPSYSYSTPGSYNVTLETYDSNGVCASYNEVVNIANYCGCQASFTYSDSNCVVTFNNNSNLNNNSIGAFTYDWNFGDGSSSNLHNPTHTYSGSGTYNVTLNIMENNTGNHCNTFSQYITINCSCVNIVSEFGFSDSNCTVSFTNVSQNAAAYLWDFGDGNQSSLENPTHTYSGSGTYNVTLNTIDSNGIYCNAHSEPITVNCNCTYYDTTHVTIYDTVSISVMDTLLIDVTITSMQTPNNTNTIKVYPNPTNDVIYIDNGNYSMMSGYSINILNSGAQSVYSSPINTQTLSLNVSQLGAIGTYFLQILDTSMNVVEIRHIVLQ